MANKQTSFKHKLEQWYYTNPNCPHCRAYDFMRLVWLFGFLLLAFVFMYYFRHDTQSQCCKAMFQFEKDAADVSSKNYVFISEVKNYEKMRDIVNSSNLIVDNYSYNLGMLTGK